MHARTLIFAGALLLPLFAAAAEDPSAQMSLQARIMRLERIVEGQGMVEQITRIEALQQELQRLQGVIEVQTHEIEELKSSKQGANQDFDRRLHELESRSTSATPPPAPVTASEPAPAAAAPSTAPSTAPAKPPAAAPPSAPPAGNATQEQAAYQQAFALLKEARYEKAITAFQDYLTRYPAGARADNAQYWLGEAYYVTRQFKEAQQAFQTLVDNMPTSPKHPDALLKIGFVHYELGQWDDARKSLSEVVKTFPTAPAAKLADTRLQRMKKEGH
ncbi:MAG: tol-pal system protein YbgF [Gammaproteobacteria bacterium]|nr:tol-pal system protein YbgF [Gammaproteobacteria bacterium]